MTDPYDSLPSLAERIAAVQSAAAGEPDRSGPAAELLADAPAVEAALLQTLFGPEAGSIEPVDWDGTGREVFLARARRVVAEHGDLLGTASAGDLGETAGALGELAGRLQMREPDLPPEAAPDFAAGVLGDSLLVALDADGWTVDAPLGEPVLARRGEDHLAPHAVVDDLRHGRLEPAVWRDRAERLGVAGLPLAPTGVTA